MTTNQLKALEKNILNQKKLDAAMFCVFGVGSGDTIEKEKNLILPSSLTSTKKKSQRYFSFFRSPKKVK